MNPFRKRKEARKQREIERRKARREALSARLGRDTEERRRPAEKTEAKGAEKTGRRAAESLAGARAAMSKGARATAQRAGAAQPAVARVGGVLGRGLRLGAAAVLRLAGHVERLLRAAIGFLAAVLSAIVARLSRLLTPERAVFVVTVAAAACLVVSQFIDYRGVEINQSAYAEVSDIVRAPQAEVRTAGEAHAYLLIPVALVAVALAALALRTRRWQLGRLVSLAGLVGVAVILLVDRPNGLDEGDLAIRYNDAQAVLGDGFYAELASAGALVLCGLLLSMHLRPAKREARKRRRERRRRSRPGKAPSLARSGT